MFVERKASLAKYTNGDHIIKITFPFDHMDLRRVKLITGRKYNPDGKYWTVPICEFSIDCLKASKFDIDPAIFKYMKQDRTNIDTLQPMKDIAGLKKELYAFQKKGVAFIEAKQGRALVADDQGLGKTAQALAWLQMHPELIRTLVVVPASVKLNWKNETKMWMTKPDTEILNGTKPYGLSSKIVIINYDILKAWADTIIAWAPQLIIADEIQYCKSSSTLRTKALKKIAKNVPHFIALSGTPIVNRPVEFYNAIKFVEPTLFPNYWHFTDRYCGRKHNGFGWDFNGATNTQELHEILTSTIMIRRLKKDVLTELPDKIRSFFPLEMSKSGLKEYQFAEKNFIAWVRQNKGAEAAERVSNAKVLAEIEGLKQLAVKAKMAHAIDWIQDFLDTGEKLVVFATHKFVIDELMDTFGNKAVKIDGSVSGTNRQLAVDKFQNEANTRLFVGNIQAAGVGITLTAASNVAFLELPWSPAATEQAGDRCHRIGQKNTVNIYYLLAEDTIEERIAKLLDAKRVVLAQIMDGKEPDAGSLLTELIENYE